MRSRRLAALSLMLAIASAACNSILGFGSLVRVNDDGGPDDEPDIEDAGRSPRDGSTNSGQDADTPDSPAAPARCNRSAPFGAPTRVAEFVDPVDSASAVLRSDELEAYFLSFNGGGSMKRATRSSRDAAWQVGSISLSQKGNPVSMSADGLTLYLAAATNEIAFLAANRGSIAQNFSLANSVTAGSSVASPMLFVAETGDRAYFARRAGSTDALIAWAGFSNRELSSMSFEVEGLEHVTGAPDDSPVLNHDETVLYFFSARSATKHVWRAERPNKSTTFSPPVAMDVFNGEFDVVTWVSDDDCVVYLDREQFVWRAERPK